MALQKFVLFNNQANTTSGVIPGYGVFPTWGVVLDGSNNLSQLENAYNNAPYGTQALDDFVANPNDWAAMGGAADFVNGEGGDDVIYGGSGNDQLWGELGADVFTWKLGDRLDLVFQPLILGARAKASSRVLASASTEVKDAALLTKVKAGDKVKVPPKRIPYFKPGKELRELLNDEC